MEIRIRGTEKKSSSKIRIKMGANVGVSGPSRKTKRGRTSAKASEAPDAAVTVAGTTAFDDSMLSLIM